MRRLTNFPVDIALGQEGRLYILCRQEGAALIRKYTVDDEDLGTIGENGNDEGKFQWPVSVIADKNEKLFVSDEACFERVSAQPPAGVAGVLRVPPGRAALADAAHLVAGAPSRRLHLMGVTGTSGKTTVSHLAAQLYGTLGKPCGVIGSLGMFRADRAAGDGT